MKISWRPEQATGIGRRVEDSGVGLFWLEDVTTHDDYAGLARVNAALATPICGGELVYGVVPFRHMIEARSVDYVMIDLIRVGGITQWMKVAGMAEAFNPAGGQPRHPGNSHPSGRSGSERPDCRIHGLGAEIV
jgi:L-alanine-DL-glutamate epimerase-like enolase superfamily enzyme